jgi:hypothetical protein
VSHSRSCWRSFLGVRRLCSSHSDAGEPSANFARCAAGEGGAFRVRYHAQQRKVQNDIGIASRYDHIQTQYAVPTMMFMQSLLMLGFICWNCATEIPFICAIFEQKSPVREIQSRRLFA